MITQPSQTITVTDGSKTATSSAITVNPPASKLVYTTGTQQSLGIDSLSSVITVQRQDLNSNPVSAGNTNVGLTSTSSNYKFYSDVQGTQEVTQITIVDGSDSADCYYKDSSAGTPTLTASSAGLSSITTTFTISAGVASKLAVSGFPNPTTAGIAGTVTVTAQDQNGNTDQNYVGTVQFTSSDAQVVLPADYTFLSSDHGVKSFSVTLKTAGTQSITATDSVTQSITGSQTNIQVNAAGASQLIFTAGKDQTVEIGTMSTVITVQRQDAYGNPTTSGGLSVTLHTTSGGGAFYLHNTDTTPLSPSIVTIANGFSSTDFYYKDSIRGTPTIATVTGLTEATTTFNIEHHVSITITSNPVGSGFATVDGNAITTPQTFNWLEGSSHTVAAAGTVSGGTGIQYVWTSWSDSGAASHTYIVPVSTATVTAVYKTQYQISFAVNPSGSGSTIPTGTNVWEDSGSLSISATPLSGYTFSSWSATAGITITNPSSVSTTVTLNSPGTITATFTAVSRKTIFSDDFENGWKSQWTRDNTYSSIVNSQSHSTSHSARITASNGGGTQGYIQLDISTTGSTSVQLSYWRMYTHSQSGATLIIEWRPGTSGTWTNLETLSSSTAWGQSSTFTLTGADNLSTIEIRYRLNGGRSNDFGYIDDVLITGLS